MTNMKLELIRADVCIVEQQQDDIFWCKTDGKEAELYLISHSLPCFSFLFH